MKRIPVITTSDAETTSLHFANMITCYRDGASTRGQRFAYCLALYAAGASVFMADSVFARLIAESMELAKTCKHLQMRYNIERSCTAAAAKQDFDFSDFPGLCNLSFASNQANIFPQPKKLPTSNDLRATLTRLFAEAITAGDDYELPVLQMERIFPEKSGRTRTH